MKVLRSRVIAVLLLIIGCVAVATIGAQEINVSEGVAIEGYDAVAYHAENEAVLGSSDISVTWNDVSWHFSSEENKELFVANPEQYAPEYGGYCAFAAANDYIAPVDPHAFSVVDEKLYLNFNREVRGRWTRDIDGHIESADENWPGLLVQLQESAEEQMDDDTDEHMDDDMDEHMEDEDESEG